MSDLLSDHVKEEIDHWKARFPEGKQRSAVISALHAVQHENNGYLTAELMNAVADYLDLPTIQVYEVATFYSMFQTKPVGRHNSQFALMSRACCAAPIISWSTSRANSESSSVRARKMAASTSNAKRNALRRVVAHR